MRALPLALAIVLALPAAQAGAAEVRVQDFRFQPDYTRIEPGETIDWRVTGTGPHTVTAAKGSPVAFDSGQLSAGDAFSQTFPAAGRYPYLCSIHDFMTGVVQVGPDTVPPKLTKLFPNVRGKRVWVAFNVSETAQIGSSIARAGKPKRKLRTTRARKILEGKRSLFAKIGGLKPGRYRITLTAKDPEGNAASATARFKIPKPKKR